MISNFDDSFDDDEEPEVPLPHSPDSAGAMSSPFGGAFMNAMKNLLRGQLPDAERKFANTKTHPDALKVLRGTTIKDISSWFFHKQEAGDIPGDWPSPNCEKTENESAMVKALDWPTFVLFTSLIHSGDELTMLPSSYDEIRHFIWHTNSDVVLVWDSQSTMAQMAIGDDKANYLTLKDACDNHRLVVIPSMGIAPHLSTAFKMLYSALEELDPATLKKALDLAAERYGDVGNYRDYVTMSLEVWARMMVHQVHGFHLHRCVVHGVLLNEEEEGRDTPIVRMKLVLCHREECGDGSHHDAVTEAIAETEANIDVDSVIDELDDAFEVYRGNSEWTRIEANEWVLTPRAKSHLEELLRSHTLEVP